MLASAAAVVPPLEVTRARNMAGSLRAGGGELDGTRERLEGEAPRRARRKPQVERGLLQGLDEIEHIGRAAARHPR